MKCISKAALAVGFLLVNCQAYASIPNNDRPTPLIGPTLALSHTSYLTDNTAYSVAAELGIENLRGSVTFGWMIRENQRLKGTFELLSQQLKYTYFSGNEPNWISQGAIGADYAYGLGMFYDSWVDLDVYYSHAQSKSITTEVGRYHDRATPGLLTPFINRRHIAGSDAFGINPGFSLTPWFGTTVWMRLNYDWVDFNTHYSTKHGKQSGLGGSARVDQLWTDNVGSNIVAEIRQPLNYYYVDLTYRNLDYMGRWNTGLFADYVDGKGGVNNSWNIGVRGDYFFDPCVYAPVSLKGEANLKGEVDNKGTRPADPFVNWVSDPAVRMPTVLAIADQDVTRGCALGTITNIATLPPQVIVGFTNFPTAQLFAGTVTNFSIMSVTKSNPADIADVTIDTTTGVVTVDPGNVPGTLTIVVAANNGCSTATTTLTITHIID